MAWHSICFHCFIISLFWECGPAKVLKWREKKCNEHSLCAGKATSRMLLFVCKVFVSHFITHDNNYKFILIYIFVYTHSYCVLTLYYACSKVTRKHFFLLAPPKHKEGTHMYHTVLVQSLLLSVLLCSALLCSALMVCLRHINKSEFRWVFFLALCHMCVYCCACLLARLFASLFPTHQRDNTLSQKKHTFLMTQCDFNMHMICFSHLYLSLTPFPSPQHISSSSSFCCCCCRCWCAVVDCLHFHTSTQTHREHHTIDFQFEFFGYVCRSI